MKWHDYDITEVYSLDIETNQYYNYSAWVGKKQVPADYENMTGIYNLVVDSIATVADAIPVDYIAGRDIMMTAYDRYVSSCESLGMTPEDIELAKGIWDEVTAKGAPLEVVPSHSEMYLCCITHHTYCLNGIDKHTNQPTKRTVPMTELTLDSYKQAVINADREYYYTPQEVGEAIRKIYDKHASAKTRGRYRALIVIHNLSYEVNNCLVNTSFFTELVQQGKLAYLSNNAANSYKSMELLSSYKYTRKGEQTVTTYPAVYIRDTWKLTGKSIKALGKAHGYPKLDYEYDGIRHKEDLTTKDYNYNARDTEIALLGLYDALCQYDAVPDIELRSVPVSQNNIVSSIAKHLFSADYKMHKQAVATNKGNPGVRHMTAEQYASYKPTTGGGLVTVNPQYAYHKYVVGETYNNTEVKGIYHIDLNSAHPSQVFKRNFPACSPVPVSPNDVPYILDVIKSDLRDIVKLGTPTAIAKDLDRFADLYPHLALVTGTNVSGYGTFKLKNVKAKDFHSCGETYNIPVIWSSKIVRMVSGVDSLQDSDVLVSNKGEKLQGKIVSADELELTITFEDLAIIAMFCDFELVDAYNVYIYKMQYCSPYLYNQFCYFGRKKNLYKKIVKACDKHLPYADVEALCNDELVAAADRIAILTAYAQDAESGKHTAESLLKVVKAQFNGIYGTAYQSLYRDHRVLKYDDMHDTLICTDPDEGDALAYDEDNSSGIDVLQGSYIAQWSRVDIALNTLLAINCGAVPLYIATDSIYMLITQETRTDIRDIYGIGKPFVERPFNKQTPAFESDRPNVPDLGGMDFENDIEAIAYTQPLKIIAHEVGKDEPSITFSGVSADVFFDGYTDVYSRLLQEDGYVSRLDSNKSTKAENSGEDSGFVLDTVSFINNNTGDDKYIKNREAAIKWDL